MRRNPPGLIGNRSSIGMAKTDSRINVRFISHSVNLARSAAWRGEKGGGRKGEGEEKEKAASMAEIGLLRNHGRDGTCSSPTPSSARRGSNPALRCLF
jgi:hypothetical protein